jgi:hypothetical protein
LVLEVLTFLTSGAWHDNVEKRSRWQEELLDRTRLIPRLATSATALQSHLRTRIAPMGVTGDTLHKDLGVSGW